MALFHDSETGSAAISAALPDAAVRRFLLRAGFHSSSARAAGDTRRFLRDFLAKLVGAMLALAQHDGRRSFRLHDVLRACAHFGITVYGYDDLVTLPCPGKSGHEEVFHVTELVECRTSFSRPQNQAEEPDLEPGERQPRTDFVANYMSWTQDGDDDDFSDPELSEWSGFSDSDSEAESDMSDSDDGSQQRREEQLNRSWHQDPSDQSRFIDALQCAQEIVDEDMAGVKTPENKGMEADAALGQGYFSDCESESYHHSTKSKSQSTDEDDLWDKSDVVHEVDTTLAPSTAQAAQTAAFKDDGNQYVISRSSFRALFVAILNECMHIGELSISTVALSALHNTTEQYLHRALSEDGSLRFRLQTILMEQEFVRATTHLQSRLQAEREKVIASEQVVDNLKAAFEAKELAMQQQIAQLQQKLVAQGQSSRRSSLDVDMKTPTPKKRKKSPAKRKASAKGSTQVVRKEISPTNKPVRATKAVARPLRSQLQELSRAKKPKTSA